MMNYKHLSQEDRKTLLRIANDTGPVEMLRCLSQIIATQHPDLTIGDGIRSQLLVVANDLNSQKL